MESENLLDIVQHYTKRAIEQGMKTCVVLRHTDSRGSVRCDAVTEEAYNREPRGEIVAVMQPWTFS